MNPTATARIAPVATNTSSLLRRFKPGIADQLFLAIALWLVAFTATGDTTGMGLLRDSQTGYHIKVGEYVLKNHHVPTIDFLSFTKPGESFFAWEWLSGVGSALLNQWGGLALVMMFAVLVLATTIIIMLRHLVERGANIFVAIFLMHMAIGSSSIHYLARPHIFTLLFFAYGLWVIDRDLRERTRLIWTLVPITLLWANLHGGFAGILVSIGILAAGKFAEWIWTRDSARFRDAGRYSSLAALCFAASLVNPYGIQEHLHILKYLSNPWYARIEEEFMPPTYTNAPGIYYAILLACGIVVAGRLIWKKQIGQALVILAWAYASSKSMRHIPLYVMTMLPGLAAETAALWRKFVDGKSRKSFPGLLEQIANDHQGTLARIGWFTPLASGLLLVSTFYFDYPKDFPQAIYPTNVVNHHMDEIGAARVFTTDGWGMYLTYRFPDTYRVYSDGRNDFFGEEFTNEYIRAINGEPGWEETLRKYDVKMALVPPDNPITAKLKADSNWRLEEEDAVAALFTKKAQ